MYHYKSVPQESLNDHAAAFAKVLSELNESIASQDEERIATAARWYSAYPQLFFRNPGMDDKRNTHTLKVRLQKFLPGDYHNVVMFWRKDFDKAITKQRHKSPDTAETRKDFDKAITKQRHKSPDTAETRADHAVKLADKGFYSRAVSKIQSKGLAYGPGVREQLKSKHPTTLEHDWSTPAPATVDMAKLKEILRTADPLVGVCVRGMHSEYLKVLVTSRMMDADSAVAFQLFYNLGNSYLSGAMPPWLRRHLGAGCLTALSKEVTVPGTVPDARPVKAEDFDASAWTKAAQQRLTPALMQVLTPKQLGVGVSGGVELMAWGLKMWHEKCISRGIRAVAVSLDIANAHNTFYRESSIEALNSMADVDETLQPLPRASHSLVFQKNEIFMRDINEPSG
jgi:uncharacterized short protein YbdD (DUF466 family)